MKVEVYNMEGHLLLKKQQKCPERGHRHRIAILRYLHGAHRHAFGDSDQEAGKEMKARGKNYCRKQ